MLTVPDDRSQADTEMRTAFTHGSEIDKSIRDPSEPDLEPEPENGPGPGLRSNAQDSEYKDEKPAKKLTLDLLDRIKGMYRLLDLINEQGGGGAG